MQIEMNNLWSIEGFFYHMSEYYGWYDEAYEAYIYIYIWQYDHIINNHNFHFFDIQNISLISWNI